MDDLADPSTHPEWASEFFGGPPRPLADGTVAVDVPMMGGPARMKIEAAPAHGVVDLYLAPGEAPFGPPLPVRVIPNDGADVLWTLARQPGMDDAVWEAAVASMERELLAFKRRHEQPGA